MGRRFLSEVVGSPFRRRRRHQPRVTVMVGPTQRLNRIRKQRGTPRLAPPTGHRGTKRPGVHLPPGAGVPGGDLHQPARAHHLQARAVHPGAEHPAGDSSVPAGRQPPRPVLPGGGPLTRGAGAEVSESEARKGACSAKAGREKAAGGGVLASSSGDFESRHRGGVGVRGVYVQRRRVGRIGKQSSGPSSRSAISLAALYRLDSCGSCVVSLLLSVGLLWRSSPRWPVCCARGAELGLFRLARASSGRVLFAHDEGLVGMALSPDFRWFLYSLTPPRHHLSTMC